MYKNPPCNLPASALHICSCHWQGNPEFVICSPFSLLDILVLKPKHQLTAEAKSKVSG